MKTIFRPNTKVKEKRKRLILSGALVALILIVIIFSDFSFRVVNRPAMFVLSPFLGLKTSFGKWMQSLTLGFIEKKTLQAENEALHERIMEMETKIALSDALEKENSMLKAAFSAETRKNFLLASIISRPPQTPYDMLIIDSGSSIGVKEGMQVSAFGSVLLGYVVDVFPDMSKIKLISSFGEETNVLLESLGIPVIAVGRGGENFEITLPRTVKVDIGERVITLGNQPMLVGIIEKIEHQTTDPLQKIIFRLPVNIQYLNRVFLLKANER